MPESNARLTVGAGAHQVPMTVKLPPFVLISRDTIHLELKNFESRVTKKYWCFSAFSVFLTCLSVVLTATQFGDFLGIPGGTWHGVFVAFTIVSLVATVWFAVSWCCLRKEMSTEYALEQMCSTSKLPSHVTISASTNASATTVPLDFGS